MTAPALSNYLADLAERAGGTFRRGHLRTVEAAADYIETARLLAEARDACRGVRGAWGAFLTRADIPETTARLLVRIAGSDLTAEVLAEIGIRGAARALAKPKPATVAGLPVPASAHEASAPSASTPPARPAVPVPDGPPPMVEPPALTPAKRARARRQANRAEGLCACGRPPVEGRRSCAKCTERSARQNARRQDNADVGKALLPLAPRLTEAAEAGAGLELPPSEVAELAGKVRQRDNP